MGQGRRQRGGHACIGWPAAGAAGQIEIAAPSAGVGGPPQPGTRGCPDLAGGAGRPAEKGGEMKNGACHLSRNNA